MCDPKIDFMIIGAQKSASTFIHMCLQDHPEVFMPVEEISYFENPDYNDNNLGEIILEASEEVDLNKKKIGIRRPSYLTLDEVPERIFKNNPNIKLIAILRNPIERAISSYFHYIKYGFIPLIDFEKGLKKIFNSHKDFYDKYPKSDEIAKFGLYGHYLSNYYKLFKKKQLKIFLHEDIVANPNAAIKDIYSFLNLREEFNTKNLKKTPQKVAYNYNSLRLFRLKHRFEFDYNETKTRLYYKKSKSFFNKIIILALIIILKIHNKIFNVYKKPKLSKEVKKIIFNYYKKDIIRTKKLISRNLDNWTI